MFGLLYFDYDVSVYIMMFHDEMTVTFVKLIHDCDIYDEQRGLDPIHIFDVITVKTMR